jgi:hypothetical protein
VQADPHGTGWLIESHPAFERARQRAACGVARRPPYRLRARGRSRGVRAEPGGLAGERELPYERGHQQHRRQRPQQLDRGLPGLGIGASKNHAPTIPLGALQLNERALQVRDAYVKKS